MLSTLIILALVVFLPLSGLVRLLGWLLLGAAVLLTALGQWDDALFALASAGFAALGVWLRGGWLRLRAQAVAGLK